MSRSIHYILKEMYYVSIAFILSKTFFKHNLFFILKCDAFWPSFRSSCVLFPSFPFDLQILRVEQNIYPNEYTSLLALCGLPRTTSGATWGYFCL
jgi:hypothetical protein